MKATLRCSQVVYGIAMQHFASLDELQATSIEGFSWTCPENPQNFPWLVADELYVVGGDLDNYNGPELCQTGLPNANYVSDGRLVADADINWFIRTTRYCIEDDTISSPDAPCIHEFEYDGVFDVNLLTIHYKTAAIPGEEDIRLVISVEYDGRQIYSAGRTVENCEMPSAGDLGDLLRDYTICDGWYKNDGDNAHEWKMLARENAPQTVVIPAGVDEISDDAFANSRGQERLYIKEGACIDLLPGRTIWDCVKLPQSQRDDFFGSKEPWGVITNGFFSGTEVQQPEFTFKKCDDECVRWMELKPREFQYICSLAFELPRDECDEVGGRWLFTRSPKSGNLLLQLASAFMVGTEVEQDFPMALRCCEHAVWCAIGDGVPFALGEAFPGVDIGEVDQSPDPEIGEFVDLFERANRMKEEVLTYFHRLDVRMLERDGEGGDIACYRIPDHAFEGRDDLRDVLLPDELRDKHVQIGRRAFANCPNLRSISVQDVTDRFRLSRCVDSFEGCHSLTDRIQYSPDGTTLLYCFRFDPPRDDATPKFIVCDHVRSIADFAFQHFDDGEGWDFMWGGIDDVDVKDIEARKIGTRAFEGCQHLFWVSLCGREFALGARAFLNCTGLNACEFGVLRDVEEEIPGIESPISYLDISAQSVFEGCEHLLHIRSIAGERGLLVLNNNTSGAQFVRCSHLFDIPPIIAAHIPQFMFEECANIHEVKCVATRPEIVKAVISGNLPATAHVEEPFCIASRAFAHCQSLERFKFCRLRVCFRRGYDPAIDLIDENPKQVMFGYEAFLDCGCLCRRESSFASVLEGSDLTAFSGCPEFDGFVEN